MTDDVVKPSPWRVRETPFSTPIRSTMSDNPMKSYKLLTMDIIL